MRLICFNTQPPEGGWGEASESADYFKVSTHSRPKAAGCRPNKDRCQPDGFNTQPPEGGWLFWWAKCPPEQSFNTQPPEGGWHFVKPQMRCLMSFNTQPPEGGWKRQRACSRTHRCFNTQPPEGGWMDLSWICAFVFTFQHTAARRRLEPLSKALLHQVSQPQFR